MKYFDNLNDAVEMMVKGRIFKHTSKNGKVERYMVVTECSIINVDTDEVFIRGLDF